VVLLPGAMALVFDLVAPVYDSSRRSILFVDTDYPGVIRDSLYHLDSTPARTYDEL